MVGSATKTALVTFLGQDRLGQRQHSRGHEGVAAKRKEIVENSDLDAESFYARCRRGATSMGPAGAAKLRRRPAGRPRWVAVAPDPASAARGEWQSVDERVAGRAHWRRKLRAEKIAEVAEERALADLGDEIRHQLERRLVEGPRPHRRLLDLRMLGEHRLDLEAGSMRMPRILTWASIRPRNSSSPLGRRRTRSPVR